ncbi:MAG: pilus assembly protein [Pseudomonadota bacterium]
MKQFLAKLKQRTAAVLTSEDGTATVGFAISLPATLLLFSVGYEGGLSSTRHVLLQHALEKTVREVRIGEVPNPTHSFLIERICEHAGLIPDCENQVRLEMVRTDVTDLGANSLSGETYCRNREEDENKALVEFSNTGFANDLMFLRACALFDPIFAGLGFGERIATENGNAYALVATSGYVVEPF